MTREQAYKKFKKIDSNIKWSDFNLGYMTLLDDIYDDFEKSYLRQERRLILMAVMIVIVHLWEGE